jgi:hypothetical protein
VNTFDPYVWNKWSWAHLWWVLGFTCKIRYDRTLVKSKRHKAGQTSSADVSMRRAQAPLPSSSMQKLSPEYKKQFWGKCFWCFASDHKVTHYHDPPRCLNCFGSGHLAHRCNAPPRPHLQKPNIHSHLTFPLGSIYSCLTIPDLSYAKVVAAPPSMAQASFVVGSPR